MANFSTLPFDARRKEQNARAFSPKPIEAIRVIVALFAPIGTNQSLLITRKTCRSRRVQFVWAFSAQR